MSGAHGAHAGSGRERWSAPWDAGQPAEASGSGGAFAGSGREEWSGASGTGRRSETPDAGGRSAAPGPGHARGRRRTGQDEPPAAPASRDAHDDALVRIHDLAGRPRGIGFVADHHGTLITSHEAVDGLPRLLLYAAEDRHCVVGADAVTALPELNLALVRTEGLGVEPLPVTARSGVETGAYVRIAAGRWREARVLGTASVTYTSTERFHLLDGVLELAIGTAGQDALRLGGGAAGGPVLDASTGAVLGVLGTALQGAGRDAGFAVPLLPAPFGPLADLLAENAATVPAYGADLNLAGVLELTATSVGQDGPPGALAGHIGRAGTPGGDPGSVAPVERAVTAAEFEAFAESPATVLALVGPPGSGRTTELAALAARRNRGPRPAPTLWLRGADLRDDDTSIADAARRALTRAARIVAASRSVQVPDLGELSPERLAHLAHAYDRPLLLLLDGPEEMPPVLAHRMAEWTEGTVRWLGETGARLVVACRGEYWESARLTGEELLCVPLADLDEEEAHQARSRYGIPDGTLTDTDARHPLTLRLLSEVRAALPGTDAGTPTPRLDRNDVFAAHLDLMCLRIAVRLAAENGLRGTPVRRLAAKVSGQIHEAARRSLGPGQGELDRESFEAVFPWGQAPARLGGGTGWASAVLTEGLLVPAGNGYRFAHEELADWLQGTHLDLDEALHALVHRRHPHPYPVPHHRIGPVVQALLLLARQHGTPRLAHRLEELIQALDADPRSWWAARLLTQSLLRVPDATPYTGVLRLLADRVVDWRRRGHAPRAEFDPDFWLALPLPPITLFDLLRRLVLADGPPQDTGPRFLDAAAQLLTADPTAVQPHLTRWFDDERPLPATPHATVAKAAQALLHTHRQLALDDLTEVLVDSAHQRADELLAVLAEDEPSALCRAVDRWAHDERPDRRVAAAAYGLRTAPHVTTEADRELLRYAALTLLARPADCTLHGGALALLVRDPHTRARHLPQALGHFRAGDPHFPPSALVAALATHPEPVLDAFRARLRRPGAGEALRTLADVTTPTPARRIAVLVREAVEQRPETAADVAAYVDRRLDQGPGARSVLFPLVTGLLAAGPEEVRAALAAVLSAPGTPASRPLRDELREFLLAHERTPAVLDALLRAAARHADTDLRELVHRTGLLLVRTPEGAARYDRSLVDLARQIPGFAAQVAGWLTDTPQQWAAVVGPSARRMIENLAWARVPA